MNDEVYIITPAHNSIDTIDRVFSCLLNQTYKKWRWIVVDDGSTDSTLKKLHEFAKIDSRVLVKSNTGLKGAGGARNHALKFVDGNLLAFLDADDEWYINFLEVMIQKVVKPNSMAFSGYIRKYPDKEYEFIPTKRVFFSDLFRGSDISCLTAIYHFADNRQIPKFGEIRARNDLIFNLRALQVIKYADPVAIPLAIYHINSGSLSRNKLNLIYWQYYVSRFFKRSRILSLLDLIYWMIYGLKKYKVFKTRK